MPRFTCERFGPQPTVLFWKLKKKWECAEVSGKMVTRENVFDVCFFCCHHSPPPSFFFLSPFSLSPNNHEVRELDLIMYSCHYDIILPQGPRNGQLKTDWYLWSCEPKSVTTFYFPIICHGNKAQTDIVKYALCSLHQKTLGLSKGFRNNQRRRI